MLPTLGTILGQKSAQQTCDSGTCPLALIVYNNPCTPSFPQYDFLFLLVLACLFISQTGLLYVAMTAQDPTRKDQLPLLLLTYAEFNLGLC